MSAQDILKMIEEVDPNDTAKLDEIDARVWCFLNNRAFHGMTDKGQFYYNLHYPLSMAHPKEGIIEYARSRDTLKAIRPEGWHYFIDSRGGCKLWSVDCTRPEFHAQNNNCGMLRTEELAELHAIIQAIDFERTK